MLLKLPSGEGWRFRSGGQIAIEESVYLGGDQVRRTEQIVLGGSVKDHDVETAWVFEQIARPEAAPAALSRLGGLLP
ncbi:MAG: heparinase II/III family protein [Rhizomicrobium sp.]